MNVRVEIRPEDLERLTDDLGALSNLHRVRLLHLLTRPRYGEEIAKGLGIARQSALRHIAKLEERGFVRALHGRRATGPVVEYQVVPQRLFELGVSISRLGRLEAEGGPAIKPTDKTVMFRDEGELALQPPPTAATARLIVVDGPKAGATLPLTTGRPRWTVGRDQDRDLVLAHDPFVSGRHAELQSGPAGLDLVDAFSANGTFVNFARIPRGGRVPLTVGDIIGIGHTAVVLQRG